MGYIDALKGIAIIAVTLVCYGIYLFQFVWLKSYDRYINYSGQFDGEVRFLISHVVLLLISYVLTRFFEKPIIKRVCQTNLYKTFLDNS